MKYIVSTTTHTINGSQIDAWSGDEIEASSMDEAIKEGTNWEASLMKEDGATDIQVEGNTIFYTTEYGEQLYKEIHADLVEE